MTYYQRVGSVPPKRHTQHRRPSGELLYEELFSAQGFADAYSLLYHVSPPTEVRSITATASPELKEWRREVHRAHLLDTLGVSRGGDFVESRKTMLFNDDVVIAVATPDHASRTLYRNAMADEFVCIAAGEGDLITPFGTLAYGPQDMIVIPRGTTQFWQPKPVPHQLLLVESRTRIAPPSRYRDAAGQFSEHSPICERDIRIPRLGEPRVERGEFVVSVKVEAGTSLYHLARHPFDVVGWDGCFYPYAINMSDFEPVTRRIHTMPDEAQIFETRGAAICCLVPRLMDYHPLSIPAPPYHSSVDVDEVVFNLGKTFMGWPTPSVGLTTFHPRGIPHGPKPGGYERSIGMKTFDGLAIMVDVTQPLRLTKAAQACDDPTYPLVWLTET